jgi:hypothetical protein
VTSVRLGHVVLPAADVGPENPLAPLVAFEDLHVAGAVPAELAARVGYGRLPGVLPCLLQDGYSRSRSLSAVPAIEIANSRLRATVLPGLGGRLWSLVHVPTGRELLYRNAALQPANLALRNAWFAGGVEWNLGSTGHTTLTCSPMHAGVATGLDGSPVLRLWEWERTRNLPYQLDFWLPSGVDALLVGVRVRNPHGWEVPAYWWSNAAVPLTADVRVLAPASSAWRFGSERRLERVPVPVCDGVDASDPWSHSRAADFFFDLPPGQRPWIAAVDRRGRGLAVASTSRLRGRKLFVWGRSAGGRRWQEWLSPGPPSEGYFEIQAGLATTQLEHLPMPAGASWHWIEAYLPIASLPSDTLASLTSLTSLGDADVSWEPACRAVESALEEALPAGALDRLADDWLPVADAPIAEQLSTGSGWGALELERARRAGEPIDLPGTPFGAATLGPAQRPWLELLSGSMPDADASSPPGCTLVSPPWRALLERAADSWLVSYHRGVARWYAGDRPGAVAAWQQSVRLRPSAWALRNLAVASSSQVEPAQPSAGGSVADDPAAAVDGSVADDSAASVGDLVIDGSAASVSGSVADDPAASVDGSVADDPATASLGGSVAGGPTAASVGCSVGDDPAAALLEGSTAGGWAGAAALLRSALDTRPDCLPLRIECAQAMLAAGRPADTLGVLDGYGQHGRCQLLRAQAMLALGDAAGAQAVFDAGFEVADLREGEDALTELWFAVQRALGTDRPLPARYDFRMG